MQRALLTTVMAAYPATALTGSKAGFSTVYDLANDSIGLQFPLIGLGLIVFGLAMRLLLGRPNLYCLPPAGIGVFIILVAGVVPWWDHRRLVQAVATGEAQQVEGMIRNWQVRTGRRISKSSNLRSHYEHFSVGRADFSISWNSLEAGFANRGSEEGAPKVRLANGMRARIRYVPVDGPEKPPRIVRIELAAPVWVGASQSKMSATANEPASSRVFDEAGILSAEQETRINERLYAFEQLSGHQFVIVTKSSPGGQDIAKYATGLANRLGIGRRGVDDGILLLVVPIDRQARIVVGRGLEGILTNVICEDIMATAVVPLFRRDDIYNGIDTGAAMIIGTVLREELQGAQRDETAPS